jgi:soluble lytic murein transglycosylase
MSRFCRTILLTAAFFAALTSAEATPGVSGGILSATDRDVYSRAFAAANRGDWRTAESLAAKGHNPLAAKLLLWRRLTATDGIATFEEADAFRKANPDWPLTTALTVRAEGLIDRHASPGFVIGWFAGREPTSALGKIRLGMAEIAAGKIAAGESHVRSGWIEGSFTANEESFILQRTGMMMTPEISARRLDTLLWRRDYASVKREMARASDADQAIAAARIAVETGSRDAQSLVAALTADQAASPGLLFDLARAARKANDNERARIIFDGLPTGAIAEAHPAEMWNEISIAARQSLQDGNAQNAYRLVSRAGIPPEASTPYADSQFMAGWIALRFLKAPQTALKHFRNITNHAGRPISLARGFYWQGRAREAAGDVAGAWAAYGTAAQHRETFYGMLALARIEENPTMQVRETSARMPSRETFETDELVCAMRVLADLDQQGALKRFAMQYRTLHPDAGAAKRLVRFLSETGFRMLAIRVAKSAGYDDIVLPEYAFPVIPVPAYRGPGDGPEPALVLALIRQETEFDPDAVSPAGALGLMQIMPAGAKRLAKLSGLPDRPKDLIGDPTYNMQLGMTEYARHLHRWEGSLILAACAYNAGPTNAKRWIAANGDPREPNADPIDWIEEIPYGETRNYVQRILENLQVYRARIAGGDRPLRIVQDLYGTNPVSEPLHYTPAPRQAPQQSKGAQKIKK